VPTTKPTKTSECLPPPANNHQSTNQLT